jgi:hypothetical protein
VSSPSSAWWVFEIGSSCTNLTGQSRPSCLAAAATILSLNWRSESFGEHSIEKYRQRGSWRGFEWGCHHNNYLKIRNSWQLWFELSAIKPLKKDSSH